MRILIALLIVLGFQFSSAQELVEPIEEPVLVPLSGEPKKLEVYDELPNPEQTVNLQLVQEEVLKLKEEEASE